MTSLRELLSWARVRLAAGRGSAVALGLIVMVTAFCAAAAPLAVAGHQTQAFQDAVRDSSVLDRSVSGEAVPEQYARASENFLTPSALDEVEALFTELIKPPLRFDAENVAYGARNNTPADVPTKGLPRPSSHLDPQATLAVQQGQLTDHARIVEGEEPSGEISGTDKRRQVSAAITQKTAKEIKLGVGDSFTMRGPQGVTKVTVSALIQPRQPDHPYWTTNPLLADPHLEIRQEPGGSTEYQWQFGALLHTDAASVLRDIRDGAALYWHHPIDADALTADLAGSAQRQLKSLTSGGASTTLDERSPVGPIEVSSGLSKVITDFQDERDAVSPLVTIALFGVGAAALSVLLMTAALTTERRRNELALLRARGGSLPGLLARLLLENALVVLPASAVGVAAAFALTETRRVSAALLLGGLVALVALLASPLRALWEHRVYAPAGARRDLTRARPSRRRTVAELTVLALVCAAVVGVRGRGEADSADPLLAATPVLLSLAAAIVLLRAYPWPLRLLGAVAARARGPVAFLGLARAGRAPSGAGLPLLALLMTLTVASFGGAVLTGVSDARDQAALSTVGADAKISNALGIPPEIKKHADRVDGVADSLLLRSDNRGVFEDGRTDNALFVVIADPKKYADLAQRTGLGPFPASALADDGGETLPVIASPGAADRLGEDGEISASGVRFQVRPEVTTEVTPAVTEGDFVVLSADAVSRLKTMPKDRHMHRPTMLLITSADAEGTAVDSSALRSAAKKVDPDGAVTIRAEQRDRYTDSALQSGAGQLYLASLAAALCYSALALLLSLLQTAPERSVLLARLRAMGLPRRQVRGLLVVELLPQYVLALGGGLLVTVATVLVLRPAIDLTALAGTAGAGPAAGLAELTLSPVALVLPALGILALGGAALLTQAWLMSRPSQLNELRMVD